MRQISEKDFFNSKICIINTIFIFLGNEREINLDYQH